MRYDEKKSKEFNYDPNLHSSIVSALEYVLEETEC
jgi:hypothetical protein